MKENLLYVFVEGADDERFFRWYFRKRKIKIIKYAQEKRVKTNQFIQTIQEMEHADYIFMTDKDNFKLNEKLERIQSWYPSIDLDRVYVAIQEVEGWYLAGVTRDTCKEWGIRYYYDTNDLVKEDFNALIPRPFLSRIDFMLEILKNFSMPEALRRNRSFRYFVSNNRR
ncbi:MAG: hypothetical protein ACOYI4_04400 [Christensenellales bacterium]|jgi:hypothetical protein